MALISSKGGEMKKRVTSIDSRKYSILVHWETDGARERWMMRYREKSEAETDTLRARWQIKASSSRWLLFKAWICLLFYPGAYYHVEERIGDMIRKVQGLLD